MIDERRLRQVLSENVPRLRKDRSLSQQEFAERLGIHRVTVAKIETGRLTPGADLLFSIADVLGVSTDALRQVSLDAATPAA